MNTPDLIQKRKEGGPLMNAAGGATLGNGLTFKYHPDSDVMGVELRGQKCEVTKLELWQFVFSICDPNMREQLMPVRQTEVTTITKVHAVQVKKPLKPGDILKVRCHTNVPTSVVEGLQGLVEKKKSVIAMR